MTARQPGTVHVVGAGLAGLSTAVVLAGQGVPVVVHEATSHAGGRCRSYDDPVLGCRIDNGTHVLVGANRAAFRYLDRVGARGRLTALGDDGIPFADRASGARWRSQLGGGLVPWWLARSRRVPGTSAGEYLRLYRLFTAARGATVTGCLGNGRLMERLWRPLTEAALNTAPEEASARLLVPVVRGLMLGGAAAARIFVAATRLDDAFVGPGLGYLATAGAEVRFASRLRALDHDGRRVTALDFDGNGVALGAADAVVLAVPGPIAAAIVPGTDHPRAHRPIVNVHFRLAAPPPIADDLIGMIGGTAHWFHRRGEVLSATISAAVNLADWPAEAIAEAVWDDARFALGVGGPPPPHRVVKERLATFAQTPAEAARRPGTRTRLVNLMLAGDWTDTGLPATLDGAARSGERAAAAALRVAHEGYSH